MTTNIFEAATKNKVRFDSPKGLLTVEDLWDLHLTSTTGKPNLDRIARDLYNKLNEDGQISFVTPVTKTDDGNQLKFNIVKHIIDIRIAERDSLAEARVRSEKKQTILGIIAQKEAEKLVGTDLDELRRMAESL